MQLAVHANHRQLDQVRSAALQRRIHGGAFGEAARGNVLRMNVRDAPHASAERAHDTGLANLLQRLVTEAANSFVAPEVFVDILLRLALRTTGLLGQTKRAQAIYHTIVDRLRLTAMLVILLAGCDSEHRG